MTLDHNCRRCGNRLRRGRIETTVVIYRDQPAEPPPVMTMRQVMQAAAMHAVTYIGHTTKAANALGIPHARLKQLLREAGTDRDRRYGSRKREQ
jgi:hypothetical protein